MANGHHDIDHKEQHDKTHTSDLGQEEVREDAAEPGTGAEVCNNGCKRSGSAADQERRPVDLGAGLFPVDQIHAGQGHDKDAAPCSHVHINTGLLGDEPQYDHDCKNDRKLQLVALERPHILAVLFQRVKPFHDIDLGLAQPAENEPCKHDADQCHRHADERPLAKADLNAADVLEQGHGHGVHAAACGCADAADGSADRNTKHDGFSEFGLARLTAVLLKNRCAQAEEHQRGGNVRKEHGDDAGAHHDCQQHRLGFIPEHRQNVK